MKVAILNWNAVVPDLSKYFEVIDGADFLQADAIIATHDANSTQAAMARTAREYGIPVFVLQHGRFAASDYRDNGKEPAGDYFLAWGDADVEMAIAGGWKKEQVIKVGAPVLMDWVKPKKDGKTVVFAPAHIEALQSKNAANDNEALQLWERIRAIKGIKPVIKLLAGEHPEEMIYGEKFITNRNEPGHIEKTYRWLLKRTSCVISQAEGTFELLAYSMDIPVVRMNEYGKWSTAADVCGEGLELAVKRALANPEHNREKRQEIVDKEGGGIPSNALQNIVGIINQKVVGKAMRASKTDKCGVITYFVKEMNPETYHRIAMPLDKIAACDPEIAVKKVLKGEDSTKIANGLMTDLLVFPPTGEHKMIDVAYRLKELGKKIVVDMDDNVFNINPFSQKYYRYGTQNVKVGEAVLWQDKKNIDLFTNQAYIENLQVSLEIADMITVPTREVGKAYDRWADKVRVLPTCIDANVWQKLPMIKDDTIRIGWHGDAGCVQDIAMIKNALSRILRTHKNTVLVMLGARFNDTLKDLPQERIEHHPMVSADALPYKLAALNLDIAIVPNKDTEHSVYKSPIQWLEYAALEVPIVCSMNAPFTEISAHGEAGVFIEDNDEDGWVSGLEALIEDRVLRSKLSGEAHRLILDSYDINKTFVNWSNAYRGLYN